MTEDTVPSEPRDRDAPKDPDMPRAADPPGGGRARKRRGAEKEHTSFFRELPVILVAALVLSLLIKTFLVQAFFIPSGSMEETLLVGDRVFVNKLATRFGDIERGDIVVFEDPADWLANPPEPAGAGRIRDAIRDGLEFVGLAPSATGDDLIKRVIGVGGDRVVCCDIEGRITVNDVPLDEPYLFPDNEPSVDDFDVTVPAGTLWMMGDHREVSEDSRRHQGDPGGGFVPESKVIGRAFVIVWPLGRFSGISRPDSFEELPAPAG